jgi:hypothetical protein
MPAHARRMAAALGPPYAYSDTVTGIAFASDALAAPPAWRDSVFSVCRVEMRSTATATDERCNPQRRHGQ